LPPTPIPELAVGSRLLTVNTYKMGEISDADLFPGTMDTGRYVGFYPIIADFICANQEVVDCRKANIEESEWARTLSLGIEYLIDHPGLRRDGAPSRSAMPAKLDNLP
jgi:hypothetical protein